VERDVKAELRACLFDTTWLATMVRKNSPKDMGNDKIPIGVAVLTEASICELAPCEPE
jgi:hypothetical protein